MCVRTAACSWHNLNLTHSGIADLLSDTTWYRLLIPDSELAFDSFDKVRVWQEVAQALLRKYVERYYTFRKRAWELPHLEYRDIDADDPNFPCIVRETGPEYGYRILIEESQEEIVEKRLRRGRGGFAHNGITIREAARAGRRRPICRLWPAARCTGPTSSQGLTRHHEKRYATR